MKHAGVLLLASLLLLQGCNQTSDSKVSVPASQDVRQTSSLPLPAVTANTHMWVGDLPLCADTVDDASIEVVEMRRFDGNDYFLNLRLTPKAARKFAKMTTAMMGEELPIILAGKVLISPRVNEPILGGTLQISGGKEELDRALEALDEACR